VTGATGGPGRVEAALERIAAACLMAVMLIVFADVGARYLLSMPFSWSYELIGMYLMPTLFYFSLASTHAAHHHVAVDLLRPRMPRGLAHGIDLAGSAATGTVFAVVAWLFARSSLDKLASDAVVMGVVQWPSWIPDAIVAIGSAAMVLRLGHRAWHHARAIVTGGDPVPPEGARGREP
jgi:TRAP-type C4-dicarboxylate transport system permease small subunit